MSEFVKRPHANLSPTKCMFCDTSGGPFVDTHIELPGYGHVWVCAAADGRSGCVRQMARLDGMFDPDERKTLVDEILDLETIITKLQTALKGKQVPIGELVSLLSA